MTKLVLAMMVSGVLSSAVVLAQEQKEIPVKGWGMRERMTEMQGHIGK